MREKVLDQMRKVQSSLVVQWKTTRVSFQKQRMPSPDDRQCYQITSGTQRTSIGHAQ